MNFSKQANVAGSFYPQNKLFLQKTIISLLNNSPVFTDLYLPKAIIVPHASYLYSGSIAAIAYNQLLHANPKPSKVILIGPAHFVSFVGIVTTSANSFITPLGETLVDQDLINIALKANRVTILDSAFEQEHCLEVQLPFLQEILSASNYKIVPFLVGNCYYKEVANLLKLLWEGPETLIIISSDLSHYYDYATANKIDQITSTAIEQLAIDQIKEHAACGRLAIQGLLRCAIDFNLNVIKLSLKNSGDTCGDKSRVVGYGAYCLC